MFRNHCFQSAEHCSKTVLFLYNWKSEIFSSLLGNTLRYGFSSVKICFSLPLIWSWDILDKVWNWQIVSVLFNIFIWYKTVIAILLNVWMTSLIIRVEWGDCFPYMNGRSIKDSRILESCQITKVTKKYTWGSDKDPSEKWKLRVKEGDIP